MILFITRMITDRIGRHKVLLPLLILLFPAVKARTSKHTHISALWLLFTVHNLQQSWLSTICNQLMSYIKLNFEAFITSLLWKHVEVESKRADLRFFYSVTIYVGPWTQVQLTKVSWQLVITEVGPWLAFPKEILKVYKISWEKEVWVAVCHWSLQTLMLFKTKILHFAALLKTRALSLWC